MWVRVSSDPSYCWSELIALLFGARTKLPTHSWTEVWRQAEMWSITGSLHYPSRWKKHIHSSWIVILTLITLYSRSVKREVGHHAYRAVASYLTTVNQLYISLLILGYLCYLLRLCGKRVVGCTMNSETRAAWKLSFYYDNYRYSAVITGKSNEYCAEIVS